MTTPEAEALLAIRARFLRLMSRVADCTIICGRGAGSASTCAGPAGDICRLAPGFHRMPRFEIANLLLSGRGPSTTPLDGPALGLPPESALSVWDGGDGAADLAILAESCGGRRSRRLKGAYYTAPAAVRLMARLALWAHLHDGAGNGARDYLAEWVGGGTPDPLPSGLQALLSRIRILDPACGSGAFLLGALDELRRLSPAGTSSGRIVAENLFGVDSDPVAVAACRHALWLVASGDGSCPFDISVNVECGDSLLWGGSGSGNAGGPARAGGYDIVLANPPYVRHEFIPGGVKSRLQSEFPGFSARSDLYVYFFGLLERLLRKGGVAAVICPTAWMYVGYGAQFSSFLVERFEVIAVIRSEVERWFPQASVDAGIVLLRKPAAACPPASQPTAFVRLMQPLADQGWGSLAGALDSGARSEPGGARGLFDLTLADCRGLGAGKWGCVFHPAPLRELYDDGRNLCRLGDVATVKRGFTTGANDFFYVIDLGDARGGPENGPGRCGGRLRMVKPSGVRGEGPVFQIPAAMLRPLIKSPREVSGYMARPDTLRYRVLALSPGSLRDCGDAQSRGHPGCGGPAALVMWGEERGFNRRPTCAARSPWWSLRMPASPPVVWAMTIRERFFAAVNCGAQVDARLYGVYPAKGVDPMVLAAVLNSSIVALQAEQSCRTYGGGGGPLDTKVYEVCEFLIPHPGAIPWLETDRIVEAFREMLRRDVLPAREEAAMPDRARLDEAVLRAAGVGRDRVPDLAKAVRDALCESVAFRTSRARRVISTM